MSISDKMVYLRSRHKMSTEELSEKSGVPVGTLNKLFNGETKNPTGKTASKIAKVFGVTAEYLINNEIPIDLDKKKAPLTDESQQGELMSALREIGAVSEDGRLTDRGRAVITDLLRNNAELLKNAIDRDD